MITPYCNKKLLQACVVIYGDTFSSLAEAMNVAKSTLSHKVNGQTQFTPSEIKFIMDRYELTPEEVVNIFLK